MTKPLSDEYDWLREDIAQYKDDWVDQCTGRWISIASDLMDTIDSLREEVNRLGEFKSLYEQRAERHQELDQTCWQLHEENKKLKELRWLPRMASNGGRVRIVQMELKEANAFIAKYHRHHKPVVGHRFSIGASKNKKLVGVCIVGRPVARAINQKEVVEVTRLCTDGTKNACSFLYSAAARVAKNLGYQTIQTYILKSETAVSLKASGWQILRLVNGRNWNCKSRGNRRIDQPMEDKVCWGRELNP